MPGSTRKAQPHMLRYPSHGTTAGSRNGGSPVRRLVVATLAASTAVMLALPASARPAPERQFTESTDFLVLYRDGVSLAAAHAAVAAAGGTVVRENTDVGLATVRTSNLRFVDAISRQAAI